MQACRASGWPLTVALVDLPLYLLLGLLHFTRNVFFALTAFVLVNSYLHRPVLMRNFWPRRFLLVGIPYVVWSAIYFVANDLHTPASLSEYFRADVLHAAVPVYEQT